MTGQSYPRVDLGASVDPEGALFPALERARARRVGRRRNLPRQHRRPRRRPRVRLLRRPALRQRPAALRPPAHRLRQGSGTAVPDDARTQGRAPVRLGLPRPARRTGGGEATRHHRQVADRRDGPRRVQRVLQGIGAALHRRVACLRHPSGPLGRFRQRLQDARPRLHGVGHLGVQAAVGQGPDLPGLPGAAVLLVRADAAVEPRDPPRRRLQDAPGSGGHGGDAADRRRVRRCTRPDLDHHAVDPAVEPRDRRAPRPDLCRGAGARRSALRPGQGTSRSLRAGTG